MTEQDKDILQPVIDRGDSEVVIHANGEGGSATSGAACSQTQNTGCGAIGHSLRRFLYPDFPIRDLPRMAGLALLGSLLAGIYGVLHDQITYTISPEYFTRLKFDQFDYARPGEDAPRLFAGRIGFLATWWVGGMTAWILCRVSLFNEKRIAPFREMAPAFGIVFLVSFLTALGGWGWGLWRRGTGYGESWLDLTRSLGVVDTPAFMSVAYIHNSSYLGGVIGSILSIVFLARARRRRMPG